MSILLSKKTISGLEAYAKNPKSILLIQGEVGCGTGTAVDYLVKSLKRKRKILSENTLIIEPVKTSISIEQAREVKSFLKLRASRHGLTRLVIINKADFLTIEAQNALLKILEDTPDDVLFILTSTHGSRLLPTIMSRSYGLRITNPTLDEYIDYYKDKSDNIDVQFYMSDGRAEYIDSLIVNLESDLALTLKEAKTILKSSKYERLLMVDQLTKNEKIELTIFSLTRLVKYLLKHSNRSDEQKKLVSNLRSLNAAEHYRNRSNPNMKLLLTNLMLQL